MFREQIRELNEELLERSSVLLVRALHHVDALPPFVTSLAVTVAVSFTCNDRCPMTFGGGAVRTERQAARFPPTV